MECKVSIIVPVYQAEKYLKKCLFSLVNQNLSDYEIICVDDGSTDNSKNIISSFKQRYSNILYIYQENRGVSSARNLGVSRARGKYIMFVDADDYIKKNSLRYLYKRAEKEKADILVFGGKIDLHWKAPEWMRMAFYTKNKVFSKFEPDILYEQPGAQPSVCNKVFLKDIIKDIQFREDICIAEDQTFLFTVIPKAAKIVFSSKVVYRYRIGNENSAMHRTRAQNYKRMEDHIKASVAIISFWKKYGYIRAGEFDFSKWLTAFLREPYNYLSDAERQQFSAHIEAIYSSINMDNQLLIPESKYEGGFSMIRIIKILFRDVRKLGLRGGMENLIFKLLFRG